MLKITTWLLRRLSSFGASNIVMSRFTLFGRGKSKDLSSTSVSSESSNSAEPTPDEFAAAAEASARRKLEKGVITEAEFQEVLAMNARLRDERAKDMADDAAFAQQRADEESRLEATTEAAAGAHENAKAMLEQGQISQVFFFLLLC